ncbi:MAG: K(+)-transporting ATPase subunit F [Candidatus Eisenbacteria bacterium]|uniref:K(+)-transporting ATPase subunit F n=1 Tax=Eiseniibacteriota bacterium TaxID=2212470 RepID=A0A933SCL1_UNCEI|nr:K(+)-transporting ATPase subunit F [Candidatus Eisenbacteria bacterium]
MDTLHAVGLLIAIALFLYLAYALVRPERF